MCVESECVWSCKVSEININHQKEDKFFLWIKHSHTHTHTHTYIPVVSHSKWYQTHVPCVGRLPYIYNTHTPLFLGTPHSHTPTLKDKRDGEGRREKEEAEREREKERK